MYNSHQMLWSNVSDFLREMVKNHQKVHMNNLLYWTAFSVDACFTWNTNDSARRLLLQVETPKRDFSCQGNTELCEDSYRLLLYTEETTLIVFSVHLINYVCSLFGISKSVEEETQPFRGSLEEALRKAFSRYTEKQALGIAISSNYRQGWSKYINMCHQY